MFSLRNSLLFSAVKFFFQLVGIVLFRPVNLHNLFGRKYFSEFIIILLTHIQYLTTLGKTSFYLPLHLGIRQHRFRLRLHAFLFRSLPGGGVLTPEAQSEAIQAGTASFVSPNWLISTYLVLTFGELLLSPMGISFVSKVAPPKYKGMMMGGWFVATAIGNYLTAVAAWIWGDMPLWIVWGVLVGVCLVSAVFIFSVMKKLEKVA